jgi:hypothetical protein
MKSRIMRASELSAYLLFKCAGCSNVHCIPIEGSPVVWQFEGTEAQPTLRPSVKYGNAPGSICHFILTSGMQHFIDDSTMHAVRGTVPLPDLDPNYEFNGRPIGPSPEVQ